MNAETIQAGNIADQPAFPDPLRGAESSIINQSPHTLPTGMTMKQYYAGQAMMGLLGCDFVGNTGQPAGNIAKTAVEHADALIAELSKP